MAWTWAGGENSTSRWSYINARRSRRPIFGIICTTNFGCSTSPSASYASERRS